MKRKHFERGTSMVEFAVAATALLLFMFGIIEFGRMLYVYHTISNAARIGSRWAMVRGTDSCVGAAGKQLAVCPATSGEVASFVQSQVSLLDSDTVTVTAAWSGGNAGCTSTTNFHAPGCLVTVTASDQFNFAVPFISKATVPISSTSQMVIAQ